MFETSEERNIIECLHFLLSRLGRTNKSKLSRLIYIADKNHLIKYGRTITEDNHCHQDILPLSELQQNIIYSKSCSKILEKRYGYNSIYIRQVNDEFIAEEKSEKYNYLSGTDIEILDLVINNFSEDKPLDIYSPEINKNSYLDKSIPTLSEKRTSLPSQDAENKKETNSENLLDFTEEQIKLARDIFSGNLRQKQYPNDILPEDF